MGIGGSPGGLQLDKASFSVGRGRGKFFVPRSYKAIKWQHWDLNQDSSVKPDFLMITQESQPD